MKLSQIFTVAGLVAGEEAPEYTTDCARNVELLLVHDGSQSYMQFIGDMEDASFKMVEQLKEKYEHVKVAMTAFTDKPIPFKGFGYGRGISPDIAADYCYKRIRSFDDSIPLKDSYYVLKHELASGGDYPENTIEGIINSVLDPNIGFSKPELVYNEDNELIVRIALIVTDNVPQLPGYAAEAVSKWNRWPNEEVPAGLADKKKWRFWDYKFFDEVSNALSSGAVDNALERYHELVKMHDRILAGEKLSDEEQKLYDSELAIFGPEHYDMRPYEYGYSGNDNCMNHEYPDHSDLGRALKETNVKPIFVISPGTRTSAGSTICQAFLGGNAADYKPDDAFTKCTVDTFAKIVQNLSDSDYLDYGVVDTFDGTSSDGFIASVLKSIEVLTEGLKCPLPPTPTEPTEPETTTEEVVVTEEPTVAPIPSEPSEKPTEEPEKPAVTEPVSSEEEGEDTTEAVVVPPPSEPGNPGEPNEPEGPGEGEEPTTEEEEGGNGGMIAGAAGGAGAAIGAAGLLAKKFGMLSGAGNGGEIAADVDVEGIDSPIDREAIEEVTMDLFN